jgi:hypothetical protein
MMASSWSSLVSSSTYASPLGLSLQTGIIFFSDPDPTFQLVSDPK